MDIISTLLKLPVSRINPHETLTSYGFDSISFVSFTNQLNERYKLKLAPAIFFEYPTIELFASYLVKNHAALFIRLHQQKSLKNNPKTLKSDTFWNYTKHSFPHEKLDNTLGFFQSILALIKLTGVICHCYFLSLFSRQKSKKDYNKNLLKLVSLFLRYMGIEVFSKIENLKL